MESKYYYPNQSIISEPFRLGIDPTPDWFKDQISKEHAAIVKNRFGQDHGVIMPTEDVNGNPIPGYTLQYGEVVYQIDKHICHMDEWMFNLTFYPLQEAIDFSQLTIPINIEDSNIKLSIPHELSGLPIQEMLTQWRNYLEKGIKESNSEMDVKILKYIKSASHSDDEEPVQESKFSLTIPRPQTPEEFALKMDEYHREIFRRQLDEMCGDAISRAEEAVEYLTDSKE